jgi:hypothetical protein
MRGFWLSMLVGLVLVPSILLAADEPTPEQRAAHRARIEQLAASITVEELVGNGRVPSTRREKPLLVYNDNTRRLSESSLWVWTQHNRPVAVVAVEHYPNHPMGPRWLFELVSLSDHRLSAARPPELQWTSRETADAWRVLDGVVPARIEAARLAQMRQLQQRFRAWEGFREGATRTELRPLTSPLLRFSDLDKGVIDGAIFAFANGTNPEVFLVFEARGTSQESSVWQYRLAQMTGAEVTVELDDKPVWKRPDADPPAERPSYINGWFTAAESP